MAELKKDLCEALGFELSARAKAIVIHEPAATEFMPEIRDAGILYREIGFSVMRAAYASYLYQKMGAGPVNEVSRFVEGCAKRVGSALMTKYGLSEYVIRGNTVNHGGRVQIGAAQRLVAAIYRERGYLFVYDFLVPLFESVGNQKDKNYKSVVQYHAQARRLGYRYDTKMSGGTAHEPTFESRLTVGSRYVIGSGRSKKLAESDAAKKYVARFGLKIPEKKRPEGSKTVVVPRGRRAAQLRDVARILGLNLGLISISQLDAAFTHISYLNFDKSARIDARQHLVGACVLDMLAFDYVIDHFDFDREVMSKMRTHIASDAYIGSAVNKDVSRYVLVGGSVANTAAIKYDRLMVDAIKNVVGTLWSNYCKSRDEAARKAAVDFVYGIFENGAVDMTQFFRNAVQEVVQRYGLDYEESSESLPYGTREKPVYRSDVTVSGDDWCVKGSGTGGRVKSARNRALQSIVRSLTLRYPEDKALVRLNMYANPEEYLIMEQASSEEFEHGVEGEPVDVTQEVRGSSEMQESETDAHAPEDIGTKSIDERIHDVEERSNVVDEPLAPVRELRHRQFEEVNFTGPERVLHICKGTRACRERGHTITCVTGMFVGIGGMPMRVNVNYCEECAIYFLGYREYCYYRDTYGGMLGNYVFDFSPSYGYSYDGLASESPLMMCGYSVSQAQDLSPRQRHLILANVMDRGICSKARVIEYLQFFIANRASRWNMQLACSKWREDLAWVRNYRVDNQRHVTLVGVRRFS